jgi:biopolymer transport protein ExbD
MISHGSADMRFDKTIFYFLFLLAGCQGGSAEKTVRQDNVYLTIIAGGYKIYYYENKLDSKQKIDSADITEKDLLDIIEKVQAKTISQLYITVKFADEGNAGRNFSVITDILKKKNIQFSKDPVISKKETEYLGFHTNPIFDTEKRETMRLVLPGGNKEKLTEKETRAALTILLSGTDDLYVYRQPEIKNGLKITAQKIGQYLSEVKKKDSKLVVIIKPSTKASYKSLVDMLDQMSINDIKKYLLEEPTGEEENFLNSL